MQACCFASIEMAIAWWHCPACSAAAAAGVCAGCRLLGREPAIVCYCACVRACDAAAPCCRWVEDAGGQLALTGDEPGVEVSPLVSYAGEGLEDVAARTFRQPFDVFLQAGPPEADAAASCKRRADRCAHLQGTVPAALLGRRRSSKALPPPQQP